MLLKVSIGPYLLTFKTSIVVHNTLNSMPGRPPGAKKNPRGSGRNKKQFSELTKDARNKRTVNLRKKLENEDIYEVLYAVKCMALDKRNKNKDLAHILRKMLKHSGSISQVRAKVDQPIFQKPKKLSKIKSVALCAQGNFTVAQHDLVAAYGKSGGFRFLRCYRGLDKTRETCYPGQIWACDLGAGVPILELEYHTTARLLQIPRVRTTFVEMLILYKVKPTMIFNSLLMAAVQKKFKKSNEIPSQ